MRKIVAWFSAGAASAVAAKIARSKYGSEVKVVRIHIDDEDLDNVRFSKDCENWLGCEIYTIKSDEYASAEEVWQKRRYMSGIAGAPCTTELKKSPRWAFEREWNPDYQVFGYTVEERDRLKRFKDQNPEIKILTPLIDSGLNKDDCFAIIQRAGLVLPAMYRMGYRNANCVGCVKAQAPSYWNRVRKTHPDVFERRANLSREIGARLVKINNDRIFLDELDPDIVTDDVEPSTDCSILCAITEMDIAQ